MAIKRTVDAIYTYRFIRTLVTDWKKQDAYKLGLIDERGARIRSPETPKEKDAYTFYHRVVFNLKRLLEKLPGTATTKLASFASALLLLREATGMTDEEIIESLKSAGIEFQPSPLEENCGLLEGFTYSLNKDMPTKHATAPLGSSVVITGVSDVGWGVQFYEAVYMMSGEVIHITESDVASMNTSAIPVVPKPMKTPEGVKYGHFKVPTNLFQRFYQSRKKYARWAKHLDLADETQANIASFAKKHRDSVIVIEDELTGARRAMRHTTLDGS